MPSYAGHSVTLHIICTSYSTDRRNVTYLPHSKRREAFLHSLRHRREYIFFLFNHCSHATYLDHGEIQSGGRREYIGTSPSGGLLVSAGKRSPLDAKHWARPSTSDWLLMPAEFLH